VSDGVFRCFGDGDPLYEAYHDIEWGVPPAVCVTSGCPATRIDANRARPGRGWDGGGP
jgi:DNA-3-methyladenine glycosylase I